MVSVMVEVSMSVMVEVHECDDKFRQIHIHRAITSECKSRV